MYTYIFVIIYNLNILFISLSKKGNDNNIDCYQTNNKHKKNTNVRAPSKCNTI